MHVTQAWLVSCKSQAPDHDKRWGQTCKSWLIKCYQLFGCLKPAIGAAVLDASWWGQFVSMDLAFDVQNSYFQCLFARNMRT